VKTVLRKFREPWHTSNITIYFGNRKWHILKRRPMRWNKTWDSFSFPWIPRKARWVWLEQRKTNWIWKGNRTRYSIRGWEDRTNIVEQNQTFYIE